MGGYIRIVGMIPPAEEGESKRATRMRSFIAEVRGQALNDVRPGDEGRVFYAKPWWQRVIVMSAGPLHNLVLALVFFAITLTVGRHQRHHHAGPRRAGLRRPRGRRDRGRRATPATSRS